MDVMDLMDGMDNKKNYLVQSVLPVHQVHVLHSLSCFQDGVDRAGDFLVHGADLVVQFVQAGEEFFFI